MRKWRSSPANIQPKLHLAPRIDHFKNEHLKTESQDCFGRNTFHFESLSLQETLRLVTIVVSSASIATAGWMAQGSQPITPLESETSSASAALYEKASEHHISRTFDETSERGIELAGAKKTSE